MTSPIPSSPGSLRPGSRHRSVLLATLIGVVGLGAVLTAGPAFAGPPSPGLPSSEISPADPSDHPSDGPYDGPYDEPSDYCDGPYPPPECGYHPECPDGSTPLPGNEPCPPPTTGTTVRVPPTQPPQTIIIREKPRNPDVVVVRPHFTG